MKFTKLIGAIGLAIALCIPSVKAQNNVGLLSVSTNNPVGFTSLLLTNACKIAQLQILAGASGTIVDLYDNNLTNMTYTNLAYTNFVQYITNLVSTTIGVTGVTNLQTNSVLYTATNVVALTTNNALPYTSYPCQANTLATYPLSELQSKGIAIRVSNTNASIIVRYRLP